MEVNEDHPKVREIILRLREEYSSRLQMEKEKNNQKEKSQFEFNSERY